MHIAASAFVFALLLAACSKPPEVEFQSAPPPNPDAPLAFFGEGNVGRDVWIEYAAALQNAGIYNFATEVFSEEQVKNAVKICLNYSEEKWRFNSIPILVLKAEFLKNDTLWYQFTIKEESDKKNLYTPWKKSKEKKFRKQVLLKRFLEEARRVKPEEISENNEA